MKKLDQQLGWYLGPAKKNLSCCPCCEMAVRARHVNLHMLKNSI